MQMGRGEIATEHSRPDIAPEPKEVVMGLHWDPPSEGATARPDNLDAVCMLLDGERRVIEVVRPGLPRNSNGSVVHTGDSRTGASTWDDERIFVFLDALPPEVSTVAFVVSSASGSTFGEIRGASCHVSDHATEHRWLDVALTGLGMQTSHCVATLNRSPTGWTIDPRAHEVYDPQLVQLLAPAMRPGTEHD